MQDWAVIAYLLDLVLGRQCWDPCIEAVAGVAHGVSGGRTLTATPCTTNIVIPCPRRFVADLLVRLGSQRKYQFSGSRVFVHGELANSSCREGPEAHSASCWYVLLSSELNITAHTSLSSR